MVAPLLMGILSITAKELGKQIGMASISSGTNKVWALLLSDSNAGQFQEVNKKLDQVLDELGKVRTAISDVKTQIDDFHVDMKMDDVDRYANQIESLYDQYMAALDALTQAVKDEAAGSAGAKTARSRALQRLTELGTRITNEIYQSVKQINSLLSDTGDRSLLALVHRTNIDRDFLSYFCAMKFLFIRYYVVQVKASFIMSLVNEDPAVPFADGKKLIQNVEDMLLKQEQFLLRLVPDSVVKLVQAVAASPDSTPVHFHSALGGRGLHFGSMQYGNIMTWVGQHIEEWRLEPMQPLTLDPKHNYYFRLKHAVEGSTLVLTGSKYGAVADRGDKMGWKIRCAADGRFWLEFVGNYMGGTFNGNRLLAKDVPQTVDSKWLYHSATRDDRDKGQQFHIKPYVSAFDG
jgi:hypothetical protein